MDEVRWRLVASSFLIFFARRDVFRRFRFLVFVTLSLSFAFVNLVFSTSLLTGFSAALKQSAIDTYGHVSITAETAGSRISNAAALRRDITETSNVAGVSAHLTLPIQAAYRERVSNAFVSAVGIDPDEEGQATQLPNRVWQGRFLARDDDGVVIGKFIADILEALPFDNRYASVGDTLTIIFPTQERRDYRIVGIVDTKNILANTNIYLTREELEQRDPLFTADQTSEFLVRLADDTELKATRDRLAQRFPDLHVATWEGQASYINEIIDSFRIMQGVIQVISLIIGAVISAVVIHIIAEQKRREIGILYSLGATVGTIEWLFLVESLWYAFVSMLVGSGLFLAVHAYFQRHPLELIIGTVRTVIEPRVFFFVIPAFLGVTLLAGLFPALRASRERISEVIGGKL